MVRAKKQMRQLRNGLDPLDYLGVAPSSPTNFVRSTSDPTTKDQGNIGDGWLNEDSYDIFQLVNVELGVYTWIKTISYAGDVKTLKDNAGTTIYPASDGAITIKAGELIDTTATANTLTVDFSRSLLNGQIPIGSMVGATEYANITAGAGINIVNAPNNITITSAGFAGDVTLVGDGGFTATSAMGSVNVLGTAGRITTTGDMVDTLTLDVGATVPVSFATDGAAVTPALNAVTIAGGTNIISSGAGSTVTLDLNGTTNHSVQVGNAGGSLTSLDVGTSGQVLVGATAASPKFATLTSTGSTVLFTPGVNTLNLETAASLSKSFPTDSGTATPALGALTVTGAQNINTSGAGSTVTVKLNNTYQEAVAAGTLEIGTVDATQKLGSITVDALKVLLGCP